MIGVIVRWFVIAHTCVWGVDFDAGIYLEGRMMGLAPRVEEATSPQATSFHDYLAWGLSNICHRMHRSNFTVIISKIISICIGSRLVDCGEALRASVEFS